MARPIMSVTRNNLLPEGAPRLSELGRGLWNGFASVRLTVVLLSFLAATVLIGAWCPQETQVGQEKVIEAFGTDLAMVLIKAGVADIFHTFWFLMLIGLLTVNMIAGSFKYVFPKLPLLLKPMPVLTGQQITNLPFYWQKKIVGSTSEVKLQLTRQLKQKHYMVSWQGHQLTADFGRFGRLAPSITHVGLLTLLAGVTITAWTGFSGFKPVLVGADMSFLDSQHAPSWLGRLPDWKIRVNSSRREDYANGEAKQWYSNLTVVDKAGNKIIRQDISVNNPLSYQGVDVYQSSWGLGQLNLAFNGQKRTLSLQPMGKIYAAFLPLLEDCVLIFSVRAENAPVRIFAKRSDWTAPRLIGELEPNRKLLLGNVDLRYIGTVPITGLQYKCDPGLTVTFSAFALIMLGVTLAVVPHREVWAELLASGGDDQVLVRIGGRSKKAKVGFEQQMSRLLTDLEETGQAGRLMGGSGWQLTAKQSSAPIEPLADGQNVLEQMNSAKYVETAHV